MKTILRLDLAIRCALHPPNKTIVSCQWRSASMC
jgi:hypothetical protein